MTCRLILVTPAGRRPPSEPSARVLSAAFDAGDVACLVLRSAGLDDATLRAAVGLLRPLAQERDVAFLVQDRVEIAAAAGCDGVHLSDPEGYGAARGTLGGEAIVGVECAGSRHDAIVAGERGADYVAFGRLEPDAQVADSELLGWWQALMTVPCVALGARSVEDCLALARAGADFVTLADPVWGDPQGPAAAVRAIARALAEQDAAASGA